MHLTRKQQYPKYSHYKTSIIQRNNLVKQITSDNCCCGNLSFLALALYSIKQFYMDVMVLILFLAHLSAITVSHNYQS